MNVGVSLRCTSCNSTYGATYGVVSITLRGHTAAYWDDDNKRFGVSQDRSSFDVEETTIIEMTCPGCGHTGPADDFVAGVTCSRCRARVEEDFSYCPALYTFRCNSCLSVYPFPCADCMDEDCDNRR